jgi:hypothetical protein
LPRDGLTGEVRLPTFRNLVSYGPLSSYVSKLTVTHDVTDAPTLAVLVAGERDSEGAGGGWNEILSSLKTLLETGAQMPFQSGPHQP